MYGRSGLIYAVKTIVASVLLFIALTYALNYLEVALSNLKDAQLESDRTQKAVENRLK